MSSSEGLVPSYPLTLCDLVPLSSRSRVVPVVSVEVVLDESRRPKSMARLSVPLAVPVVVSLPLCVSVFVSVPPLS